MFYAAAIILLIVIACAKNASDLRKTLIKQDPRPFQQWRYHRETHYLESIIFHIAYREGSVTPERVFELVSGTKDCIICQSAVRRIFASRSIIYDMHVDPKTQVGILTQHMRTKIEHAELFQDLETAWVLPASRIRLEHRACHIFIL